MILGGRIHRSRARHLAQMLGQEVNFNINVSSGPWYDRSKTQYHIPGKLMRQDNQGSPQGFYVGDYHIPIRATSVVDVQTRLILVEMPDKSAPQYFLQMADKLKHDERISRTPLQ